MRVSIITRLKRGETLTETLTAVLIISLASVALASMIGASVKLNTTAREQDRELFSAISAMETQSSPEQGTITVTIGDVGAKTAEFDVSFYKDPQGILSSYGYGGGG